MLNHLEELKRQGIEAMDCSRPPPSLDDAGGAAIPGPLDAWPQLFILRLGTGSRGFLESRGRRRETRRA